MYFKCAQDYSLSALHHVIPPLLGSYLSLPPNKRAQTENCRSTNPHTDYIREFSTRKMEKKEKPLLHLSLTDPVWL
jgi:hypothetical protein